MFISYSNVFISYNNGLIRIVMGSFHIIMGSFRIVIGSFHIIIGLGAQWLSGRVLDSRPKGRGFEPHRRHCVVVLEQDTFILA